MNGGVSGVMSNETMTMKYVKSYARKYKNENKNTKIEHEKNVKRNYEGRV